MLLQPNCVHKKSPTKGTCLIKTDKLKKDTIKS